MVARRPSPTRWAAQMPSDGSTVRGINVAWHAMPWCRGAQVAYDLKKQEMVQYRAKDGTCAECVVLSIEKTIWPPR